MAVPQQSVHEIDSFITESQHSLSALPRSLPLRLPCVFDLAKALFDRYQLSFQLEDLDKSIFHLTESILSPPRSWLEYGPMILQVLYLLTLALFQRSKVSKQPEDAIHAAKYLRHLRDHPHAASGVSRHEITTLLVDVLEFQVELEAGNVMQNIEEMQVLCRELLKSDVSDVDITRPVTLFATAVSSKIRLWYPDQPLDPIIECLRAARKHKPDLREVHFALAHSLGCRYSTTLLNDDYEDAAFTMDEFINSSSPDSQDEFVARVRQMVTRLARVRSTTHETPEYLEEEMYRTRAFLSSHPVEFANRFLEDTAKQRFSYFGSIEGLEASSGNSPLSLGAVAFGKDEDDGSDVVKNMELLEGLRGGIRNNDITEIDEAIEYGRTILRSSTRDPFQPFLLLSFGSTLCGAFDRTKKIDYLNESISTLRRVLERPSAAKFLRYMIISQLSLSLLTRFLSFPGYRTQDIDEALELLSQGVNDRHAGLPIRFQFASFWASIARVNRHPSTSTAYENAISSMRKALHFAPTLQLQHVTLATNSEYSHRMPLDYASYRVDLGQLEEAIETLEEGRALLWSEMRHLRTSVDQLLEAHPDLGQKFAAVNRDLEELTKSIPPSHKLSADDGGADGLRAVDAFGRLLLKQRSLLKERDNLISQIQALPGFDSFLTSPSFDALRSAASSGPVIIINHSQSRSDILILLHDTTPSLIQTPRDFYHRARALKDKLLDSRHKYGLDSSHYDRTLGSVLADLYELVGQPVIDRLRQLRVPEQSRIWWCPTSVFCSLPLHAMGPIPSDGSEMRYFLDLYICSYTPTLSALIQSRNRDSAGSRSSDRPSILLVAQPDPSLPTVGGEIQVIQALDTEVPVTSLISEAATPATVVDGFRHHQFAHLACHGTLEAHKPFEAGFELHGGQRLTILEIVRSHLPTAEFAFLSACHTAEVTEGSVIDEGLHLAAAVQYCGFRSVVGTMWAMVDEDGRDLAGHFYKALFSTSRREEGIPYHERSAKALRYAVKKLRRKRQINLERWVNFVHYGA